VAERSLDDPLPAGQMEKSSFRPAKHEVLPAALIPVSERSYYDLDLRSVHKGITGVVVKLGSKNLVHASRGKVAQKPSQSRFGPTEIEVMRKATADRSLRLARLPGVDLPRMNIEDRWRAVRTVRVSQQLPSEAIGKKPEEATPEAGTSIPGTLTTVRGTSIRAGSGTKTVRGASAVP
jgi:hypothetical protein